MDFKLQYVGPKPLYSCRGISFDTRKQDKFLYLRSVAELILAIDYDYKISNPYVVETGQKFLDEKIIIEFIAKHMPDFDPYIKHWIAKVTNEIDDDLARARCSTIFSEDERLSIINNLQLLRSYRIQRAINKCVYYGGVQALANIFKKQCLKYITAPFGGGFFHVLHSLQGPLRIFHPPIDTSLEIYLEQDRLMVSLKILRTR